MSYFECPYCKKDVTSFLGFGYAVASGKKQCLHCLGKIKVNLLRLIQIYLFGIPLILVLLLFFYSFFKDYESPLLLIVLILFVVAGNLFFYLMIQGLAKFFNFRLYLPKDDIDEQMKNLPSYLK